MTATTLATFPLTTAHVAKVIRLQHRRVTHYAVALVTLDGEQPARVFATADEAFAYLGQASDDLAALLVAAKLQATHRALAGH